MTYEKTKYPDNQISVKVDVEVRPISQMYHELKLRLNSYEDLFLLRSITESARHQYSQLPINLFIACLFGQRSDRRFSENQSFDLKIICDFINSCNFNNVQVFDPHSEVSIALLNNSVKISSFDYVNQAIQDIGLTNDLILVSPDSGSYKKVFEYGKTMGLPVVAAVKHRDKGGGIDLDFVGDVEDKDCLIVDDLCDGGYTFILLARQLKKLKAKKIYLYISHAYFSKGLDPLRECIDHIYCTNSVKDLPDMWFDGQGTVPVKDFVTQYKII